MGFYYQTAISSRRAASPRRRGTSGRCSPTRSGRPGKQNYLEVFPVADASPFAAYAQQAARAGSRSTVTSGSWT